jgi:hypothetical protein
MMIDLVRIVRYMRDISKGLIGEDSSNGKGWEGER